MNYSNKNHKENIPVLELDFNLDQQYPRSQQQSNTTKALIRIYEITIKEQRHLGLRLIKEKQECLKQNENIRVIVCGGDGTLMWMIEEGINFNLNFDDFQIGIMPFGTGNDFARSTGWGGGSPDNILGEGLVIFKNYIKQWIEATVHDLDLWEVTVNVVDEGCFQKIDERKQKIVFKNKEGFKIKEIKKPMINYFSIGVDARIGLSFDRNRQNSRFFNKVVYCLEGIKKMFMKTPGISDTVEYLSQIIKDNNEFLDEKQKEFEKKQEKQQQDLEDTLSSKIVFQTNKKQDKFRLIKGNPSSLIVQNISSYGGGVQNIWKKTTKNGFQNKNDIDESEWVNQDFGDGKLEFFTYSNIFRMSCGRYCEQVANKIEQGSGPYYLKMKERNNKGQLNETYFQIDGEYFSIIGPKEIKINKSNKILYGKIRVLVESSFASKQALY